MGHKSGANKKTKKVTVNMGPDLFVGTADYHVGPWKPIVSWLSLTEQHALQATTGRVRSRFLMLAVVTGRKLDGSPVPVDPDSVRVLVEMEPAYRSWLDARYN